MKLRKKLVLILTAILLVIPILNGCSKSYTIIFETNGGSAIENIVLKPGEAVTKPADPTRQGWSFGGWYKNANLTQEYTFPETMPEESVKIYAKWNAATVDLTWNLDGGTPSGNYPSEAFHGQILTMPTNPTKSGHVFKGWYTDAALENEFSGIVGNNDVALYAKWIDISTIETYNFVPANWKAVSDTRTGYEGLGSKVYTPTVDGDTTKVAFSSRPEAESSGAYAWNASVGLCYEIDVDPAVTDFSMYTKLVVQYKINSTTYPKDKSITMRARIYHPFQNYSFNYPIVEGGSNLNTPGIQLVTPSNYSYGDTLTLEFVFGNQSATLAANTQTILATGKINVQLNFWGGSDTAGNRWVGEAQFDIITAYFSAE